MFSAIAHAQTNPIPGIQAVDVHGNLTDKGFKLEKIMGDGDTLWVCTLSEGKIQFRAEAYGKGPTAITSVRATVIDTSGTINTSATEFLSYLASLPYEGAEPDKAKKWVAENISSTSSTVIGGVKFDLNAKGPAARILNITKE